MKKSKRAVEKHKPAAAPARPARWRWPALAGAALLALFVCYGPALNGPFVFDDSYLPFTDAGYTSAPLAAWLRGVRPLLMFSFWLNYRLSGLETYSYHLLNVLLHFLTSALVFLIVRRLAGRAAIDGFRRDALAVFGACVFLLHPLQTESVSYVASRSEALSVLFFYAAFAVFLYRRAPAISWVNSLLVVVLFGAAVTTKEHTAVLPALLLLTDYYWSEPRFSFQGIRRNWRLYGLLALGAVAAGRMVWRVLRAAETAGFSVREFTWQQYFFTQCRAIWRYFRMFLLPYGQSIDPEFPISRDLLSHGAVIGLIGLVVLVAAAIRYRERFPLASYGVLAALLLFAPTSSFLPILDPLAERRLYLPMLGLILVAVESLNRWKAARAAWTAALAALVLLCAALTWNRNQVWTSANALWEDAVAKAPEKSRPRIQLGFAYYLQGRCPEALKQYEKAGQLMRHDYRLLVNWALTLDCLGRQNDAVARLQELPPGERNAHVYSLIGLMYARQRMRPEALAALETAIRLDPRFEASYLYRGSLYATFNENEAAAADYRRALEINPASEDARRGLALLEKGRR